MSLDTPTSDYDYVVLTDADKKSILEPELRNAEVELYRASLSAAYGDVDEIEARVKRLQALYSALKD